VSDDVLEVLFLAGLDHFTDVLKFFVFEHDDLRAAVWNSLTHCFFVSYSLISVYHLPPGRPAGAPPVFLLRTWILTPGQS
jgi:hypothetical protein